MFLLKNIFNVSLLFIVVWFHLGCRNKPIPDIILLNGKIFTCDSTMLWAEALAIRGDRIIAAGSDSAIKALAGDETKIIDLQHHLVVPGFNDAHVHAGPDPESKSFFETNEFLPDPTQSDLLDSLGSAVKRYSKGEWLAAYIGPRILKDPNFTRETLDRISPYNPVELFNFTGHGCILNSAALNSVGINEKNPDPVGGWLVRDPETGKLTGRLNGYACFEYRLKRLASLPDSACINAYKSRFASALKYGITSLQDMAFSFPAQRTLQLIEDAAPPIRWRIIRFPRTNHECRLRNEWMKLPHPSNPLIRISGTKWVLDGTQVEQFAAMRKPYYNKKTWYGRLYFPPDTIRQMLIEGLNEQDPLLLHAIGDSTVNTILTIMSQLAPDSMWRTRRVRIEHGNFMKPDQYERVKNLGIVIVTNPSHYEKIDPVLSLIQNGIPLAIGTDGPMNPYLNIMLAVMHPQNPGEAISREQAVIAYTAGSAYAEFAEQEKGALKNGMLADIAVLSNDIFTIPVNQLPGTESILTIVGGKIAYDKEILNKEQKKD